MLEAKGTISFDLNDPDGFEAMNVAVNSQKYKRFVDEYYDTVFRPHIKYGTSIVGDDEMSDLELKVLEAIRDKLYELQEDLDL